MRDEAPRRGESIFDGAITSGLRSHGKTSLRPTKPRDPSYEYACVVSFASFPHSLRELFVQVFSTQVLAHRDIIAPGIRRSSRGDTFALARTCTTRAGVDNLPSRARDSDI